MESGTSGRGMQTSSHRETLGAQTFGEDTNLHIAGFFILGVHGPVGNLNNKKTDGIVRFFNGKLKMENGK